MKKRVLKKVRRRLYEGNLVYMFHFIPLKRIQINYWYLVNYGQKIHSLVNRSIWKNTTTKKQVFKYVADLYHKFHHYDFVVLMPHSNPINSKTWDLVITSQCLTRKFHRYLHSINYVTLDYVRTIPGSEDPYTKFNLKKTLDKIIKEYKKKEAK